jgi:hypothetical protein
VNALLVLIAVILFVLRAFGVGAGRVDLGWLGLAFFAASFLVPYVIARAGGTRVV